MAVPTIPCGLSLGHDYRQNAAKFWSRLWLLFTLTFTFVVELELDIWTPDNKVQEILIRATKCFLRLLIVFPVFLFILSSPPPLTVLPASWNVIAHYSSLCTEADYDWMWRAVEEAVLTKGEWVEGVGLPVDECVFVLEKLRWCLYCCMGPCLSIAEVCLVRSKEVLFPLAGERFRACVRTICLCKNSAAAPFCMNRWGPLSKLTCYFNLCWPLPVIWQRSLAKTMGETVPEHCEKKLSPNGFLRKVSDVCY